MKATLTVALVGAILLVALAGCDSEQYVEKKKYDDSQKQLADLRKQLEASQKEVADLKAHKYQFMLVGFRTWRFDTTTGSSCIQLTTKADWKQRETKRQSCDCVDLYSDPEHPPEVSLVKFWCEP